MAPAGHHSSRALMRWMAGYWGGLAAIGTASDLYRRTGEWSLLDVLRIVFNNGGVIGLWIALLLLALKITQARESFGRKDAAALLALALVFAVTRQVVVDLVWCDVLRSECPGARLRVAYRMITLPHVIGVVVNFFALGWTVRSMALARRHRELARIAGDELFRAQMRSLQRQLRPHFLFNTLQSVTVLAHDDPQSARAMLLGLRRLLEYSAGAGSLSEVALHEELEIARLYLDVEKRRFGSGLEVRFNVDPEALSACTPPFLLQPLIENAVHHAIALRGYGMIEVSAAVEAATRRLRLTIADTGSGTRQTAKRGPRPGVGTQNVRSRLQLMYGDDWDVSFQRIGADGSAVSLFLPFRAIAERGGATPVEESRT